MVVCKIPNGIVGTRTGASITSVAAAPKSVYFTTTLISGVVGSLSRCYITLFPLNGYISFWLTLDSPLATFVSGGTQASIIHC